ncbi:LysR substrate-binding domain-containing protein [Ralstonia pseudosolanacearum]|uniref:LysR substrate-binding domain-containing protein n=1 Tax=Ralstonia pseudosolanacearum TaxID=1310165 RepID=UPI0038690585
MIFRHIGAQGESMVVRSDLLSDVPAFVAAAESGSFAAAAASLNLSRSAVGKSIARLETRSGARLFHRTTRTLALTEEGQLFLEHCRRAISEVEAGRARLDTGRQEVSGRLRVSMPMLYGRHCVAPILTRLAVKHPALELDLSFSDRIVGLVEDGFDLAVRNGALQPWTGVKVRRLARQYMQVCASPSYLEANGTPATLDDLAAHTAILYGRGGQLLPWQFSEDGGAATTVTPPHRLRLDDLGAICDAAVAGAGLAWLPWWLVQDNVAAGRLVAVLDTRTSHITDTYAVWPEAAHLPLRVRVAIDALAAELPGVTEPENL